MRTSACVAALLSALAAIAGTAAEAAAQAETQMPPVVVTAPQPTLTVPSIGDARKEIVRTPGGVEIVDSKTYRDGRATALKDMLDYTPGVLIQSKYGQEDSMLSIRG
jgi:iron complex outermembrane receptor protein